MSEEQRPAIGICSAVVEASWSVWNQPASLLPQGYIKAIQRAGGLAVIVPPDPALIENPDEMLERIDALILAGGHDVDPALYDADPHPATNGLVPARDHSEIALARRAVELDMPVLGICRGMQVLNVAFGGTLRQHLPEELGHEEHRRVAGSFDGSDHDVKLTEGSLAALAAGEQLHGTKSHHHQAVGEIGEGFEVTGFSTLDDLPEAIEIPSCRFVLGVQWHPEADDGSRVIGALVARARDYRSALGSV
jgi:putative glutamine amidotransferase